MGELRKAISHFIELEKQINNADSTLLKLSESYHALLQDFPSPEIEDAERIYSAYKAAEMHNSDIETAKKQKDEFAAVIKNHLVALDGRPIRYVYPHGIVHPTYLFRLNEKGEVVHNHQ
ncbi:MAG: hypothetical protein EOO85_27490 [Pedobacter sp.]|nr:MAG: hypothetical protein EOO85_27490 [Pedobacter sp.]